MSRTVIYSTIGVSFIYLFQTPQAKARMSEPFPLFGVGDKMPSYIRAEKVNNTYIYI